LGCSLVVLIQYLKCVDAPIDLPPIFPNLHNSESKGK